MRGKAKIHLWQGRFSSYVLDEKYLLAATRYILLNPVKAGIIRRPWDYKWASTRHHMMIDNNSLVRDSLLKELIKNWKDFLDMPTGNNDAKLFQLHERTGRPLGNNTFIEKTGTYP